MIKFHKTRNALMRDYAPSCVGAEIGVLRGDFSAQLLGMGVLELHLIDPFLTAPADDSYAKDPANIDQGGMDHLFGSVLRRFRAETESGRVHIHRLPSLQAAPLFGEGSLDWVFLDGRHDAESVYQDCVAWSKAVTETGVLCSHDFTWQPRAIEMGFGVPEGIEQFCIDHKWKPVAMSLDEWPTICISRK